MVKEGIKITPIEQHIINAVRMIRLELGLSQRALSKLINENADHNIIGNIESVKSKSTYTDHNLNIIAQKFTEVAVALLRDQKEAALKSTYTVYDLYPEHPLLDETPQLKTKIIIPKELGTSGIIHALLEETDFFNEPRTTKEITNFSNSILNMKWKTSDFTHPLERACNKNALQKLELSDGAVRYKKS